MDQREAGRCALGYAREISELHRLPALRGPRAGAPELRPHAFRRQGPGGADTRICISPLTVLKLWRAMETTMNRFTFPLAVVAFVITGCATSPPSDPGGSPRTEV